MKKTVTYLPLIVSLIFAFLFVYAAVNKLMDFDNFQLQLSQSPLLSAHTTEISYLVIFIELVLAFLLLFPTTRLMALYGSFTLMFGFTLYIYLILTYSDYIPCSCGGILDKMGWTTHFIFNIVCTLSALAAAIILSKKKSFTLVRIGLTTTILILLMSGIVLKLLKGSDHLLKKESNFTRHFIPQAIREDKTIQLTDRFNYFAGADNGNIYIGNRKDPLTIIQIDSTFTRKKSISIQLPRSDQKLRMVTVQVQPPYYYVYDGTVPVIYRGEIGNPTAKMISYKEVYFSQITAIDSVTFIFSTQARTGAHILGSLDLRRNPKVVLSEEHRDKGNLIFDTEGKLLKDPATQQTIYAYTYHNKILTIQKDLKIQNTLHTIDSTTKAHVPITTLASGKKVISTPPLVVNKNTVAYRGLLFNLSNLMGKQESRRGWRQRETIDIYRTNRQDYLGSFYLQNRGEKKMSQMFATDKYFYTISGNEIARYRFAQSLTRNFTTGEAENLNKE
ncbi:DoxX family protein [Elizabethkingia anophelis]|uniref:DoxX family protein n=1 Tax=Elizabethkingia anophelis TaxID=1117645 RepID=UPI00136E0820|nr:DoxX family protein [Elizabethkingia anophelis]MYY43953.1 tellurium resistance protein TerC [Elizabethkingia anophelis]